MPTELDRKMDQMLAAVTGESGPIKLGTADDGRVIVTNLPPTLSLFFDVFCMLNQTSEAVVADGERLTFGDLLAHANRLAPVLAGGFGIRKGDRVAIAMRNCPSWILTYMAIAKAGGVATLLNGWWRPDEMKHALALTEPKLVIADAPRAERIAETGLGIPTMILPVDRPAAEALAPLLDRGGEAELPQVGPDDDATILFTSGSTGLSKGALSTHRAVTSGTYTYAASLAALKAILESEGRPPANPPRTLINVPLFHVTGEVPVMLNSFVINRCMVLMKKWDPGEALRLIQDEKITYFVGVPTMSLELMQHPDRETYDLSTLTDLAAGGAPRPAAHVARLREAFKSAQPALGYGLTETNAVGCGNVWSNYVAKPDSTGRPQRPMVDLVILGPDNRPLPAGERGEIAIRSAANFKEYWGDPAATAATVTADGYVLSGDIGYLDEDDYLFIVDRKKDIIIRGGENIACPEVEAALYAHHGVAEAAVFGIPDERLGEVPVAVVQLDDDTVLTGEELQNHVAAHLAAFKVPAVVAISADPLPKLGTGKIDKVTLRKRFQDMRAS